MIAPRPRRPRPAVVAGVVTVLSAMTLAGACGRGGRSDAPKPGLGPVDSRSPVVAAPGAGPGRGPGPYGQDGIVPVGYVRSEAGAAAAATAYLATLGRLVFSDPAAREAALRRIAATSASDVVAGGLAALVTVDALVNEARLRDPQAEAYLSEVPVSYRVQSSTTGTDVQVDVWSLAVFLVEGRTEGTQVWSTSSLGLVWETDDWRVAWWVRTSGPVPAATAQPASPSAEVLSTLAGWKGFRHAPES